MRNQVAGFGVGGRTPEWVPDPSRYVLMYEPPAQRQLDFYVHWHYARGRSDVLYSELARDQQRFISPILFTDGHAASHDFSGALKTFPQYPYEATARWMWYKPEIGY